MNDEDKIKADKAEREFQERFRSLPEDLQTAFTSSEVTDAIIGIGKKHNLLVDKIGRLGDETGSVMLGLTPPKDYIKNLISKLGVDQAKAKEIAEEINQNVFQPIRESLKKIHGLSGKTAGSVSQIAEEKRELKPEIIRPAEDRITIKSDREEMDNIDVSQEIPGMIPVQRAHEVFAKKMELPKPLSFAPKTQASPLEDMLKATQRAGISTPTSSSAKPKEISKDDSAQKDIEKALGGEIRKGTVSPEVNQPLTSPKPRVDPYREPIT